jgi:Methyltransferase domain
MNTSTTHIAPSNVDQNDAWNGSEGEYWAAHAERFDRSMSRCAPAFESAAAVQLDSRVLDIGCGTGQTTRQAARATAHGSALGVDLSSQMVEVARLLTGRKGLTNAAFQRADAQVYPFATGVDMAISRTGAMFFGGPRQPPSTFVEPYAPGPADTVDLPAPQSQRVVRSARARPHRQRTSGGRTHPVRVESTTMCGLCSKRPASSASRSTNWKRRCAMAQTQPMPISLSSDYSDGCSTGV